jgi:NET1-associated nuclear protein 1 (U3 small nucleolar RNA-associated protein 17)
VYWAPRSSWSYRSLAIHSAAFSTDGTIAALAHGNVISLWDIQSNALLRTLDAVHEIREVLFVDQYLVGAYNGLIVWDLYSCDGEFKYHVDYT